MSGELAEGVISLGSGDAHPGILPDLTAEAHEALTARRAETLQYAPRPGLPALRETVAELMGRDGAPLAPSEVQIVNGAKHGLELVCRLLLAPGDSVVVTAPTYFTALPIFRGCGAGFVEVGRDAEGLDVDELDETLTRLARAGERLPKLIYEVPDFHNPSGVTLSRPRREALLALAARHGIVVVEDSPYREVRFTDRREPLLKAIDPERVILLGTFSKLVAPGLRIGWVAADSGLLERMAQAKTDGGSCPLTQRIITEFCRRGRLDEHIGRVRETYRTHRDRMVAALRRELPAVSMRIPEGGYYVWLSLPPGLDADMIESRAEAEGVAVLSGSRFFAGGAVGPSNQQPPTSFLRLAYSFAGPDEIDEGVRRLAAAMRDIAA
jgi:2-aminoadipate transaminase